jgi:hypothetical protein
MDEKLIFDAETAKLIRRDGERILRLAEKTGTLGHAFHPESAFTRAVPRIHKDRPSTR